MGWLLSAPGDSVPADGAPVAWQERVPGVEKVDGPLEHVLTVTYFDTADLDLASSGLALRRRTGGDRQGWSLHLPAAADGPDELSEPLGRATRNPPAALRDAVVLFTRGRSLRAVAELRVRRRTYRLCGTGDRTLARIREDDVTPEMSPPGTGSARWREWEVEVSDGHGDLEDAVAAVLADAGAARAAPGWELTHVLRAAEPGTAATAEEPSDPEAPASHVVSAWLRRQVRVMRYADPRVRRDLPDAVHAMRVALRRLRSALVTFRPLLDSEQTDPLRPELSWIAGVLGEARDPEVMRERLAGLLAEQPPELVIGGAARRIDDHLRQQHRNAHRAAVEALESERYFRLVDALQTLVSDPPWTADAGQPAETVLPHAVRRDWKRLRRRAASLEAASDPALRYERLHEVRKAAKRLRYAAEAVTPVHGGPAKRLAKASERVQTILGDHHDAVVTQDLLRQLAVQAHLDGDNAFTFGRLHGLEHARAADLERRFQRAWSRVRRKKLRRWLG